MFILSAGHVSADEMLIVFSSQAYAGGFEQVWQSVMPVKKIGTDKLDARQVELALVDADNGQKTGLTLKIMPPRNPPSVVTLQDAEVNTVALFQANPFKWFNPEIAPLRESFSMDPDGGSWLVEITGLNAEETVSIEWVFMRHKEGKRLLTMTGPNGTKLLDRTNVGSDAKGVYLRSGPFSGKIPLRFTLTSTGELWPCLPNALRIVRHR